MKIQLLEALTKPLTPPPTVKPDKLYQPSKEKLAALKAKKGAKSFMPKTFEPK